jgi:hypothetical protein
MMMVDDLLANVTPGEVRLAKIGSHPWRHTHC